MTDRARRVEEVAELARRMLVDGDVAVESVTVHLKSGLPGSVERVETSGVLRTSEEIELASELACRLRDALLEAVDVTGHIAVHVTEGRLRTKVTVRMRD